MASRLLNPGLLQPLGARRTAVLVVALPLLFLHAEFQPTLSLDAGSTTVDVRLSDLAVAAVLIAAIVDGRARGFDVLRSGRWVWAAAAGLVIWVVAAACYGPLVLDDYPFRENLVTAAKFAEYALLAPAAALLVRTREDLRLVVAGAVAWAAVAAAVGVLQFFGVDIFDAWPAGWRQPSVLGHHDFAALAGASLTVGLAALVLEARWLWLAIAAGVVGLVLAAPLAGLAGLCLATGALALLARRVSPYPWRRVGVAAGAVVIVALGMVAMRADALSAYLEFLSEDRPTTEIETYSQRTVLMYIGARIFLDNPLVGVGLRGSEEPAAFAPYLADARARFPDASPQAFPAPGRKYGTQSLYVQSLADLGIVGGALLAGLLASALVLARRSVGSATGVVGLLWLLLCIGLWGAQGLVAGIPLAVLTWLAVGFLVSGAAAAEARA